MTATDVQKILDKYEPQEADRRAFKKAKAEGRLQEYYNQRQKFLKRQFGDGSALLAGSSTWSQSAAGSA